MSNWMDVRAGAGEPPGGAAAGPRADLLEGLNEPQREAVTHRDGPLLILAGPGSGKTRVVTSRIAWLVTEAGVRPDEILAITFTNKAAREMRERVERLLPLPGAWISTFHAMGARMLRREVETLGGWTPDFTIYDTGDRNELLKRLLKDEGFDLTRFRPAQVGAWISQRKNSADAGDLPGGRAVDVGEGIEEEVLRRVHRRYEEALRANNALDFDDLLLKLLHLFDQHPGVRDAWSSRFRYVMVDEYQDTNRVQYRLTRHLSSFHGNLAVCGDPDQSIYAWRGADIRNILDFERDFGAPRVVRLEQNYRSHGTVLKAAQAVISHNRSRKEKDLWSAAPEGQPIEVLQCGDENDEARELAHRVRQLVSEGVPAEEVAVFYRANFQQRAIETQLRLATVPYQVVGGLAFYERREVKDLIAYLRLVANPSDDVAFRRAVNAPRRGVGAQSLERLSAWAADRRVPLARAVRSAEAVEAIRGRARKGLAAFAGLLERLEAARELSAAVALDLVLDEIDVEAWLAELDDGSGLDREGNVDELRAHAEEYDRLYPEGRLRGFLQDIALVADVDALDETRQGVKLMTLHSAKGLEFRAVFIVGLEEEILPHARAVAESVGDEGLEEERRLFYVGLTRARERVLLSWAAQRLHFGREWGSSLPSRFLEEIPPELVEGHEGGEDDGGLGVYEAPAEEYAALAVGSVVEHEHFGRGVVELLQGTGVNARATVRFEHHGNKQLLLQYARLQLAR